jgi:hypothetical protein
MFRIEVPSNYYVIVCITNFPNAFNFIFVARPLVNNRYDDIMSTSCILRSSPNLSRMPFAFQIISFTYFSFVVNYTDIFSENSIIINFSKGSLQFFNFGVSSLTIWIIFLIFIT